MEYPEIAEAIEQLEEKFAGEGRVLIRPSGTRAFSESNDRRQRQRAD